LSSETAKIEARIFPASLSFPFHEREKLLHDYAGNFQWDARREARKYAKVAAVGVSTRLLGIFTRQKSYS